MGSPVASRSDGLAAAFGMGLGGICFALAALVGLQAAFSGGAGAVLRDQAARRALPGVSGHPHLARCKSSHWTWPSRRRRAATGSAAGARCCWAWPRRSATRRRPWSMPASSRPSCRTTCPVARALDPGRHLLHRDRLVRDLALALSSAAPRSAYLRYKGWIDRAAGGIMVLLGARLLSAARDA